MVGSILNGLQITSSSGNTLYTTTDTSTTTNHVMYTVPANRYAMAVQMRALITRSGAISNTVTWRVTNSNGLVVAVYTDTSTSSTEIGHNCNSGAPNFFYLTAGDIVSIYFTNFGGGGSRTINAYLGIIEFSS